jgi:hypothetical protein
MKNLIILIGIILFGINAQAQPAKTICMPVKVAKQIAEELSICDSTKAVLVLSEKKIVKLKEKIEYKDSMILSYKMIEVNLTTQVENTEKQKKILGEIYIDSKQQYQKLAVKERISRIHNKMKSIIGIPVIIVLAIICIVK